MANTRDLEKRDGSLQQRIFDALKKQIIFCDLLPGSIISEADISKEFGSSRTPVREALLRLEKEGYITIEPRKSTRVSKLPIKEMDSIMEARLLVEPYIIRSLKEPLSEELAEGLRRIKERFLEALQKENGESNVRLFLQIDYEFHAMMASLGNNNLLSRFCDELLQQSTRHWYIMYVSIARRIVQATEEHTQIIDALLKSDFELAAIYLERHIRVFGQIRLFE
jgi:DNA-binding GntR family transcriptional regulator